MTDTDQLEQNFKVMAEKFTDADAKLLTARLEEITPYFCRMCGECRGQCPKGLPVVRYGAFRHVRGRLRPVWLGPGELPADGRRAPGSAVRRLRDLRGPVPAWRSGGTEVDARPGVVRVILGQYRRRANGLKGEKYLKSTPLVSQWTQHAESLPASAKVAVPAPFSGWAAIPLELAP